MCSVDVRLYKDSTIEYSLHNFQRLELYEVKYLIYKPELIVIIFTWKMGWHLSKGSMSKTFTNLRFLKHILIWDKLKFLIAMLEGSNQRLRLHYRVLPRWCKHSYWAPLSYSTSSGTQKYCFNATRELLIYRWMIIITFHILVKLRCFQAKLALVTGMKVILLVEIFISVNFGNFFI